jgi:chemotaxis protein CheC
MNEGTPIVFGLTELERDALTELANLGASRAATSLGRMLKEQVLLSVPRTEILPLAAAADVLSAREQTGFVAIGQQFSGAYYGKALLIFPERASLQLARVLLGETVSLEEIADLEQEALLEVGNIILNACLAAIANMLKRNLKISLPHLLRGHSREILMGNRESRPNDLVLVLYIDFVLRTRNIHGYISLVMDLSSLATFRALIQEYVTSLGGQECPDP